MVKVKICGLTNLEDALAAVNYGADYLGFVLYSKSPRYISPEGAFEIFKALPKGIKKVAVVVDEEPKFLKGLLEGGFDFVQLHGDETPEVLKELPKERVIKAFRISDKFDFKLLEDWKGVFAFLLDTYKKGAYGGTGETFNWDIAKEFVKRGYKIFLSGGLNPENVERAVCEVKPYAVDVSSGVELKKGKKDLMKLKEFISKAKNSNCGDFNV